jgi:hypothetical protein
MAAGGGEAAHVRDAPDAVLGQQGQERGRLVGGVADGEDAGHG